VSAAQPRLDFLLRRLILLAGDVRDTLATGDWEAARVTQDEYDVAFAAMHSLVDAGTTFQPELRNDLARLRAVHDENQLFIAELRASAGRERGQVSNVRKLSAYAPLGTNHQHAPQFLDGSA